MIDFKSLVYQAIEEKATDIHLTVGIMPMFRINGTLTPASEKCLEDEDTLAVARELVPEEQLEELEKAGEVDFAVTYDNSIRMRCNVFHQQGLLHLLCRSLHQKLLYQSRAYLILTDRQILEFHLYVNQNLHFEFCVEQRHS